jgi:hypothetical protein
VTLQAFISAPVPQAPGESPFNPREIIQFPLPAGADLTEPARFVGGYVIEEILNA